MHPLDAPKLGRIAERLFEISDGRLATGAIKHGFLVTMRAAVVRDAHHEFAEHRS